MATFLSSNILNFGPSSLQSLLPVTSVSQAEALLENHRIQDVIELADKQRKKVEGKFVVDPDEVCPIHWLVSASNQVKVSARRTNSRTSTRESASNACSRHGSKMRAFASSKANSIHGYSYHTSPSFAARCSMRTRRLRSSQGSPSVCRRMTRLTTSVRPLLLPPPRPGCPAAPSQLQLCPFPSPCANMLVLASVV
jgi:hypothetical protein